MSLFSATCPAGVRLARSPPINETPPSPVSWMSQPITAFELPPVTRTAQPPTLRSVQPVTAQRPRRRNLHRRAARTFEQQILQRHVRCTRIRTNVGNTDTITSPVR